MAARDVMTRPPAVAGHFYPRDPAQLRNEVQDLLARSPPGPTITPKALIAPHAGYVYSGKIAAAAFAMLYPCAQTTTRVVLIGPAHYVRVRGIAAPTVQAFATPLGDASPSDVAQVLRRLWGGPETLIVVSSDLSHYHSYETARRLDLATATAIERGDWARVGADQACGCLAVAGLLVEAGRRGRLNGLPCAIPAIRQGSAIKSLVTVPGHLARCSWPSEVHRSGKCGLKGEHCPWQLRKRGLPCGLAPKTHQRPAGLSG
jgi:hypothetical protein